MSEQERQDKNQPEPRQDAPPPPSARPPVAEALKAARQHQQARRFQKAEQIYRGILSSEPANPPALRALGLLAHRARRNDAALDLLKKAVALDPNNPDAHNDLGGVLGEVGRTPEAVAEFQKALQLKPDYAEVLGNLGVALHRVGKGKEAEEDAVVKVTSINAQAIGSAANSGAVDLADTSVSLPATTDIATSGYGQMFGTIRSYTNDPGRARKSGRRRGSPGRGDRR